MLQNKLKILVSSTIQYSNSQRNTASAFTFTMFKINHFKTYVEG